MFKSKIRRGGNWKSITCRVVLAAIAAGTLTLSTGCDEELSQKAAQTMRADPTLDPASGLLGGREVSKPESELKW
jgi:hypothetical protein